MTSRSARPNCAHSSVSAFSTVRWRHAGRRKNRDLTFMSLNGTNRVVSGCPQSTHTLTDRREEIHRAMHLIGRRLYSKAQPFISPLCLSVSIFVTLSLSLFLSVALSVSLCLSMPLCVSQSVSVSVCLCLCLCLSLFRQTFRIWRN